MYWKTCQCPEDLFARLNRKYDFAKVMDLRKLLTVPTGVSFNTSACQTS